MLMTDAEELWHPLSAEEIKEFEGAGPQAESPTVALHSEEPSGTAEAHYPGVRSSAARTFVESGLDADPVSVSGGE